MGKKITSTDVAQAMGVSQSAVSRALQIESPIGNKKRLQILQKCIAMGYREKDAENILIARKSKKLAFIVGDLHNPFFTNLLMNFTEEIAKKRNYLLSIYTPVDVSDSGTRLLVSTLQKDKVQGVFASSVLVNSTLPELCRSAGIPLVLINRSAESENISSVVSDNVRAGYDVACLLRKKGRKNMLFVSDSDAITTMEERLQGVQKYAKEYGLPPVMVLHTQRSYQGVYDKIKHTYHTLKDNKISAVICGNDIMAFGAMDALRYEFKKKIPEDYAVFGFDDIPMSSWPSYRLSTVRQRTRLMSQDALSVMEMMMQGVDGLRRMCPCIIIERDST